MKIHKIVTVIVILVCLSMNLLAQPYEGEKGDVNNDGTIDLLDILEAVNIVLGTKTPNNNEFWRADCNAPVGSCEGDGSVDLLDIVKIANISLGIDVCPSTIVTDIDGNVYQTVTIGTQVWMVENLRVTHYRNGDAIPNVTDSTTWIGLTNGAYCNYNNEDNNVPIYGRLYNGYAVHDSRNIAPVGWHIPTDEEWKELEMYLGMSQSEADTTGYRGTDEGGKMKEAGTAHWDNPNTGATNESGFTALPGGHRTSSPGQFTSIGRYAGFWSSSEQSGTMAWYRALYYTYTQVARGSINKRSGYSVRCIKD
ncbi:MAG: hypothetical protein JSV84_16930 [Gemmatimonadota bacterium]|nr:MAG: hypothetical protein JSV84_16930 [Gemmatimonadota bacterium]